ncbi:hypothetical protein Tco_0432459 [Tanacetum coccineum]
MMNSNYAVVGMINYDVLLTHCPSLKTVITHEKVKKAYRAAYKELMKKEIDGPEALNFTDIGNIHGGRALQELDEFYREPVIREYVLEFFSTISFRDDVVELDVNDRVVFQLGGIMRKMTMREYFVKEKVTLADLFYLHSMDGGELVDVPWHVAKFMCDKAKGVQKKSKIIGAHLIRRIARYFGLMSTAALRLRLLMDDSDNEAEVAEVRMTQEENEGSPRQRPNMSFTNRLRVLDDRLGKIDQNIHHLGGEREELTEVVSGMSEQYDRFYDEFISMRLEHDRFQSWNSSHMSQILSYHHLDYTRFDGTKYTYVLDIPDLGVQQGVNLMSNPQTYSTAPSTAPTDPFSLLGNHGDVPSTSRHPGVIWTRSNSSFVFGLKTIYAFKHFKFV